MLAISGFAPPNRSPLKVSKGNGKRRFKGSAQLPGVARGSALECAVILDVLVRTKAVKVQDDPAMKAMLRRIVAMLTRMAVRSDGVAKPSVA